MIFIKNYLNLIYEDPSSIYTVYKSITLLKFKDSLKGIDSMRLTTAERITTP